MVVLDLLWSDLAFRSLSEELALVRREVESLRGICQGAGDRWGIKKYQQLLTTIGTVPKTKKYLQRYGRD